jgi:hypothetical protein
MQPFTYICRLNNNSKPKGTRNKMKNLSLHSLSLPQYLQPIQQGDFAMCD